jgi:hypothetical protein
MFPAGMAGLGLLILRVTAVAELLVNGVSHGTLILPWCLAVIVPLAIFLCLGFLTPYCSALCSSIELLCLWGSTSDFAVRLGLSLLTAMSVAMLGPGAYSVDSRLFGRRIISEPARRARS